MCGTRTLFLVVWIPALALVQRVYAADPNLVGWWRMDETSGSVAADSSGEGRHGIALNRPVWESGRIDGALRLDGVNDYVELPIGPLVSSLTRSTFAIWVNWSGQGEADQHILDLGTGPTAFLMITPNYGGTSAPYFILTLAGLGAGDRMTSSAAFLTGWHHVAVTIDPDTTTHVLYVDGEPVAENTSAQYTPRSLGTTTQNWLGRSQDGTDPYFRGSLDDLRVYDLALTASGVRAVMEGQDPGAYGIASSPQPGNGAVDVPRDTVLSWRPGPDAVAHDVYFGTRLEDVRDATRTDPRGVLAGPGQDANTYDPPGLLPFGQAYAWRVDEVGASPGAPVHKGAVWTFTAEPYAYPITPSAAAASGVYNLDTQPGKTVDGSGLNAEGGHSADLTDMWLSDASTQPAWIRYDFDQEVRLDRMCVWNSNQDIEVILGYGAREVAIETSIDGTTWTALPNVPEFAQATGEPNYVHNTTVDFGGVLARHVRLTILSNWSEGWTAECGLAEVRFFHIPGRAYGSEPPDGAAGVSPLGLLRWRPGRDAASHEVWFGTEPNALALSKTVAERQVPLAALGAEYDRTYVWRIDEVNEAASPQVWAGQVWGFSTAPHRVVDDFESYNDRCSRIYYTWQSGAANSENAECGVPAFAGNGTGSVVGHDDAPYAERTAVHSGQQSMPLAYDGESEAMRAFESAQDWTQGGVQTLVLFFRGDPANGAGQLYIKVNQRRIPYTGDPGALARPLWRQWNVDLTSVPGLHAVQTLTIGVSGSARGRIFIDDIRLYRAAPEIPVPVDPGAEVLVARYPFEGDLQDHSGHSRHGAPGGNPVFVDSQPGLGRAVQFNGIDDHVALPIGTAVSGLTSATVATWVRFDPASTGSWQRIFDFGTGTTAYMFLTPRQGTSGTMRFAIRTTASAGESSVDAPGTLPGDWHHVAVAIEGQAKTMQLWLDGEVVANGPTATLPKDLGATTQNWLGRSQFEVDGYFGGVLDEFHIYDRALSVGEVRYLAGDR